MPTPVLHAQGTRLLLDGRPFQLQGLSFFNALFNPTFNAGDEARRAWLARFRQAGVTMLRVWCQWDFDRPYVDLAPDHALFDGDGALREQHVQTLGALLAAATDAGI